ncbi:MAG TPA: hypothetical protein VGH73_19030 [Thermoanaerobaculia bacterium]|jgi:fructose-1-phosphate kinase PfkB-like protein
MIRTVTLNTGFDEVFTVSAVDFGGVTETQRHVTLASGKGINAARTIAALGDACMTGLAVALRRGLPVLEALRYAVAVAAAHVEQGSSPILREEPPIQLRLSQVFDREPE